MFLHHRDQNFARQLQKFRIELTHHRRWHFDKVRYFIQQDSSSSIIASPLTNAAACLTCSTMDALRSSLSRTMPASRMTSKYLSADVILISGELYGRSPRVILLEATPAYSNGMTRFAKQSHEPTNRT